MYIYSQTLHAKAGGSVVCLGCGPRRGLFLNQHPELVVLNMSTFGAGGGGVRLGCGPEDRRQARGRLGTPCSLSLSLSLSLSFALSRSLQKQFLEF